MLDKIDINIIDILAYDGRITIAKLAERVSLSATPCQLRVKKLQKQGYIKGYRAILDHEKLDRNHIAFVEVKLKNTNQKALAAFNKSIQEISFVEQCHMLASHFDYLLKVRTKDIQQFRIVLGEVISTLPEVQSTSTHVVMENVKD